MNRYLCIKAAVLWTNSSGFIRLCRLHKGVLVVAAAADNDEDKDDPENPATVVFATAIEKSSP